MKVEMHRAVECHGCHQKRQCVVWLKEGYSRPYVQFQLCGLCLVTCLQTMLSRNLERGARSVQKERKRGKEKP